MLFFSANVNVIAWDSNLQFLLSPKIKPLLIERKLFKLTKRFEWSSMCRFGRSLNIQSCQSLHSRHHVISLTNSSSPSPLVNDLYPFYAQFHHRGFHSELKPSLGFEPPEGWMGRRNSESVYLVIILGWEIYKQ